MATPLLSPLPLGPRLRLSLSLSPLLLGSSLARHSHHLCSPCSAASLSRASPWLLSVTLWCSSCSDSFTSALSLCSSLRALSSLFRLPVKLVVFSLFYGSRKSEDKQYFSLLEAQGKKEKKSNIFRVSNGQEIINPRQLQFVNMRITV
ncbi:hypothetical protein CRG98_024097 [Punica granatum]|uniref:Uncharacterized protein n=1 Tax=Punica granatum TaxID=22663 RepID=A0A2I0JGW2_PUNGR|nr:hypothetical protein CRG98_024097 [Punica granatum]